MFVSEREARSSPTTIYCSFSSANTSILAYLSFRLNPEGSYVPRSTFQEPKSAVLSDMTFQLASPFNGSLLAPTVRIPALTSLTHCSHRRYEHTP